MAGKPQSETSAIWNGINWDFLLNRTTLYATSHVNRWRWRGSLGGVLPDGFDPPAIASQVVCDFFQHLHLSPGQPILSLPIPDPDLDTRILRNLERRVRRVVDRLHHRAENKILRNDPDLSLVVLDDGEPVRLIDTIPCLSRSPDQVLLEKEALAEFSGFKIAFAQSLQPDPNLVRLFDLFCDGRWRPDDLAHCLHLSVSAVKNLRRRFLYRWKRYSGFPACIDSVLQGTSRCPARRHSGIVSHSNHSGRRFRSTVTCFNSIIKTT
jgi:hypothetical protein